MTKPTPQQIPATVLKNILSKFDLGEIKSTEPLPTSGNITYIITAGKKKCFLRLCPFGPRWRSKKEISAELELIHLLINNNFATPAPVPMKDGSEIVSWKNHFGYLREFCAGKSKLKPDEKDIREFGKLLGNFHNLTENFKTKEVRKHIWSPDQTKKNFFEGDENLILKGDFPWKKEFVERFIEEISSLSLSRNTPSGTIHEDMGKRHVLWTKNKITGIIDFDRCYFGRLILDLGQACRGWCFENWKKWSNKKFTALISGYESKRKLTAAEKKDLTSAIKFAILERGLSFCLRSGATKNIEDAKYAMLSVSRDGLLGELDRNKSEIEKILKRKTA